MSTREMSFLVVEDNDLDFEKIQRSFSRLNIDNPVVRAHDGMEALEHIRGSDTVPKMERPFLILLDLNMPRMNGLEFLEEIRSDDTLGKIPVFVLTTSDHPRDIEIAHRFNVSGYVIKPIKRGQMLEAFGTLNMFWKLCEYPDDE